MKQRMRPGPPPEGGGEDKVGPSRKMMPAPVASTSIEKADELVKAEERARAKKGYGKPKCCGMLPCKGRTIWCYECDLCMDCITGAGCGHDNSRHAFTQTDAGDDE